MVLSVIIVNYNVKYFLEQCLCSVKKALDNVQEAAEVFVVDNHSPDDSIDYLTPRFPWVRYIANKENKGFSRANNQALSLAKGKFILFLNPDTILPEDFFTSCLSFFQERPEAGAAGVHMIDGSGLFLKESKRGFPSPWVAFCKLSGLSALFPHSALFAGYYLGHLPANQDQPASILSGACFWARREALDKTGGFDERFFMYAEDIDLSYRIEKAGYTNYYIAGVSIIHFKGESTRKDTRYIKMFYKAMSQFRRKHFTRGFPALFNGVLEIAIWLRAGISALRPAGPAKPGGQMPVPRKVLLTGDPGTRKKLMAALAPTTILPSSARDPSILLVEDPAQAEEIVYCEGPGLSFKALIHHLEQTGKKAGNKTPKGQTGVIAGIHAAGSDSVVASASKEGQGDIWALSQSGVSQAVS